MLILYIGQETCILIDKTSQGENLGNDLFFLFCFIPEWILTFTYPTRELKIEHIGCFEIYLLIALERHTLLDTFSSIEHIGVF